jgi:GDP-mannose transporter
LNDGGFHIDGYTWLSMYVFFMVSQNVLYKAVLDTVPMSTYSRVYYNSAISLPLAVLSSGGRFVFWTADWSREAVLVIALSCVGSTAISFAGFNLRSLVSATSFTVTGVCCKFATVLINDVMWSHHSGMLGHISLLTCIGGGYLYERSKAAPRSSEAADGGLIRRISSIRLFRLGSKSVG